MPRKSSPSSAPRPRQAPSLKAPGRSGASAWVWIGLAVVLGVALGFLLRAWRAPASAAGSSPGVPSAGQPVIPAEAPTFAAYAGSASCKECHEAAYQLWAGSNHGLAERPIDPALDHVAFQPPRSFRHATQTTQVQLREGRCEVVTLGYGGRREAYGVDRVIGHKPLRQFMVPVAGGRWQVLEASYDPHTNEWFNVYGTEDRQPGEWGHWTGRGMNWNQMCASCHNTRVRKNYDAATDAYRTTMVEPTVGCEACHGPLKAHVEWRRAHKDTKDPDPTLVPIPKDAMVETCAVCHSRRVEVTGDFAPGEAYFDHYSLITVDESDTYYPDGQVRDENYEYAAFLGSRMHHRNVRCNDCHEPHSYQTLLPGNWLCLRCHNGSVTNAPIIDPVAHSHHRVFGYDTNGVPSEVDLMAYDPRRIAETGGECVNCHMPQTVYMQRHWRHDHGFTSPDPLLTREEGIPNACNRCHADKTVAWSIEAVDKWYGARMDRPARLRTRTIAAGRRQEASARGRLLALLTQEEIPYWRAAALSLLEPWVGEPTVAEGVMGQLSHPHPLVREKAVRALAPLVEAERGGATQAVQGRLADPSRSVRVAAAWVLRRRVDPSSLAGVELRHQLELLADQPTGQLQWAVWYLARQEVSSALRHVRRAVEWDGGSAPLRHERAVIASLAGHTEEAIAELEVACRLDPREAEYPFKLGLAWSDRGDLAQATTALEQATRLDPRHARAWYNLGLAYHQAGRSDAGLEALVRAESLETRDPAPPYARATVLAQLGRTDEARLAARRVLELAPGHPEATALLRQLP